jgi:D-amino-acid oxidase
MGLSVLVIGAGVSGLTTAVCLAEAGADVTIRAAAPPGRTTSAAAGAVWGPVNIGSHDRVLPWARHTLDVLARLADEPGTGIRLATGTEQGRSHADLPFWSDMLPSLRILQPGELWPGFRAGWRYTAPLATMPVYLEYLCRRFLAAGGTLRAGPVSSLTGAAPVVVNCTGVAARELVPDPEVYPMRGQVVIADNPGLDEFFISRDEPVTGVAYLFPHGDTVLIGGTTQTGAESMDPDPETARVMLANAARLEPRLRGVAVRGHRVGLRPCRPAVRLEAETRDGTLIWHNYGHGGAGISVSWGCAAEVAAGLLGLPFPLGHLGQLSPLATVTLHPTATLPAPNAAFDR